MHHCFSKFSTRKSLIEALVSSQIAACEALAICEAQLVDFRKSLEDSNEEANTMAIEIVLLETEEIIAVKGLLRLPAGQLIHAHDVLNQKASCE